MRHTIFSFAAVTTLLAATGCGTSVNFIPTNSPVKALHAKSPDQVHIFSSARPSRSYIEIGLLEAQQESSMSLDDRAEVMAELREEAAALGCDAVIIAGPNDKVTGHVIDGHGHVTTLEGYRATCVQYVEVETAKAEIAGP